MELISSNWRDIQRYYQGTWVKFKESGELLHEISEVGPNYITGFDENGDKFRLTLSDEVPYHLDYVLPHRAMFQHGHHAYMLQRVPARQYFRGVCESNTRFIRVHDGQKVDFSLELLKAFVNKPQYRTLRSCYEQKYKGSQAKSWALNARAAYYAQDGYQMILMDNKVVAKCNHEKNVITANRVVYEDVFALVKQAPFEVEVTYA